MRRVISLWLPRFATDRLRRSGRTAPAAIKANGTGWRDRPLVTLARDHGRLTVGAVDAAAEGAGIFPGQALADARALAPNLRAADGDPGGDARALARLADWCGRYTPWVSCAGLDGLWLDVTGCAHLCGGEAAMLADVCARIARSGFAVRAALADTPGAAWAVARFGAPAPAGTVVPPGAARQALADLPVAGLRLGPATVLGLDRLGLRRVRDLYDLPRGPLAARFGEAVVRRLDQALGRAEEPTSPRHPPPPHRARLGFAEPIIVADDIARAIRRLLHGLCERLQREQQGLRRLEVALYRVDGTVARVGLGTARPVRDTDHLMRLVAEHLGRLDPGFGVDAMVLAAPVTEDMAPEEVALALAPPGPRPRDRDGPAPPDGAGAGGAEELAALVDRLSNRLSAGRVLRLGARDSHVPERAAYAVPALEEGGGGRWRAGRARPLRLFSRPQAIEAVAPIPDDPPVMFRWRRVRHRVCAAEGPERIAAEWWRGEDFLRDYYRVEDVDGGRFWLYREGLYAPDRPPRWFLHGLFA